MTVFSWLVCCRIVLDYGGHTLQVKSVTKISTGESKDSLRVHWTRMYNQYNIASFPDHRHVFNVAMRVYIIYMGGFAHNSLNTSQMGFKVHSYLNHSYNYIPSPNPQKTIRPHDE